MTIVNASAASGPGHRLPSRPRLAAMSAVLLLAGLPIDACSAAAGEARVGTARPATSPASASPAGTYRLAAGPDVAAELELRPDGTFGYVLAAGSLDEHASGRWTAEEGTLRLTTLPKPVPAVFAAGTVRTSADARLILHVTAPNGDGIAGVDLRVGFDRGEDIEGYTQDYGWSLPEDEARTPRWIEFAVPIHGLRSQRFPLDSGAGNERSFVLIPNDLGTVDFGAVPIDILPGRLIMHRNGVALCFEAAGR